MDWRFIRRRWVAGALAAIGGCARYESPSSGAETEGGSTTSPAVDGESRTSPGTVGGSTTSLTPGGGSTTSPQTTGEGTTAPQTTTNDDPVCGDGEVEGDEECDDGNREDGDACLSWCEVATCGDLFVNEGVEDCDDGNAVDDDACTNDCKAAKTVFVTSVSFSSNFGGLAGADAQCNQLAQTAGLPGTYMAWLSDNTGSPSTRMTPADVPYVRVDGVTVAANWADLTDGSLRAAIDRTELGGDVPLSPFCGPDTPAVWTNTNFDGTQADVNASCNNWTGGDGKSIWGYGTLTDSGWTLACGPAGYCTDPAYYAPLYCFEQ